MADFAKTKPLYYDAAQKVHRSMSEGQVVDPALLPISTDDGNELKFGTDGGMYVKGVTASDMVSAENPNFIQMDREGKLKVDGNSVLSNGGINLLTIDPVDGKITLTKENLENVIHVVSADKYNLISAGTDGGAYLPAEGIIDADDPLLYVNADKKVSSALSIKYNPGSGSLDLVGQSGSVISSVTVPSQTSALKGVYLLNGEPSATGEATAGDYHFSMQYSTDGGSSWGDYIPVTVTATKGMEAAGTLAGADNVTKIRAFFHNLKAEAFVSSGKAELTFPDGTKLVVVPATGETTYSFTPGVGIISGIYLLFVFLLSDGTVFDVYVDLTELSDIYTAGDGISISSGDSPVISAVATPSGGVIIDKTGIHLDIDWIESNIEVPFTVVTQGNGVEVQEISETNYTVTAKAKPNSGIGVDANGIFAVVAPTGGIVIGANGLQVSEEWLSVHAPAPEAGYGISIVGSIISAKEKDGGGITVDSTGISVDAKSNGGIIVDGTGVYVDTNWLSKNVPTVEYNSGNGINISDFTISAIAKDSGGIVVDNDGISVDGSWLSANVPAPEAGNGISVSGRVVSAKAKTSGGIIVDESGISVDVSWLSGQIPDPVSLSDSVSSTSSTTAASSKAVKTAYDAAQTAQTTANSAKSAASTAQSTADSANVAAQAAQIAADDASAEASSAQATADLALSTAQAAQSTAITANSAAASAQSTADSARSAAQTAQTTADSASSKANSAQSTANSALSTAQAAFTREAMIGMIAPFASTNLPAGWMICDGSSILFEDWPEFKTAYDAGRFTGMTLSSSDPSQVGKLVLNGSTGVYLPDLEGLFMQASAAGTAGAYVAPGLPNIQGSFLGCDLDGNSSAGWTGAFYVSGPNTGIVAVDGTQTIEVPTSFSAAKSNGIYSDAVATVQPPTVKYVMAMYLGKPAA